MYYLQKYLRPILSHVSFREWRDVELCRFVWGGLKICGYVKNELWGWGEWVLCSLWPILSRIIRLALMYNLIGFTDICLKLSLTIMTAKHDTALYQVMTRPLIWIACTAVALWICIHWVPVDTPDIPTFFRFSPTSANKFWLRATERPRGPNWNFSR